MSGSYGTRRSSVSRFHTQSAPANGDRKLRYQICGYNKVKINSFSQCGCPFSVVCARLFTSVLKKSLHTKEPKGKHCMGKMCKMREQVIMSENASENSRPQ